jgi:hypothetical protein
MNRESDRETNKELQWRMVEGATSVCLSWPLLVVRFCFSFGSLFDVMAPIQTWRHVRRERNMLTVIDIDIG